MFGTELMEVNILAIGHGFGGYNGSAAAAYRLSHSESFHQCLFGVIPAKTRPGITTLLNP